MTMKKITFILLFFMAVTFSGFAQVQIGTGTNLDQKVPFNASFGYSYSQSIYLASEINASGTITSLQWYYAGSGALPNNQQLVIYLGTTTKTSFTSLTDWEPVTNLTQVYSGGITTDEAPGWKTITLTTPFVYNGTSNLVVAVDENQELWDNYDDKFYNTAVTEPRSIFYYNDYENVDAANPPEAYETIGFVPTIIFGGITQACPTPFYIAMSNVTTTTATVSWQAPDSAPAEGSGYYLSTSSTPPTATTTATDNILSGSSIAIDDLQPETVYYIWVRNNCGDDLYSAWSAITIFKTDCLPVTTFSENFDAVATPDLPSCWNKILTGTGLSPYAKIETISSQSQSPSNAVMLTSSDSNETSTNIILASPNLSTLGAGTHRLRFYAKGNGNLQIGTLSTNDNSAVFTEMPDGDIDTNSTFTQYVVDFTSYTGTDHYVGIRLASPFASVYIDNVIWELVPSCPDVTDIHVPFVTTSGATISWTSGNPVPTVSWDVAIGTATDENPTALPFFNSTATDKNIDDLLDNTDYRVWVRTVCSSENGAWIGPIAFKTACLPTTSFYENFNTTTTPELPNCWSKIMRGEELSEYSWVETTQYSDIFPEPNITMQLYNDDSGSTAELILVSPNLSTTLPLGTYRLKFYAKHAEEDIASVDIVTLDSNTATAVTNLIETVELSDETTQYVVNFDNYTGTDPYIGIRLNTTATYESVFIDNILWEIIPSCPDVTLVNVPSTLPDGATINWTGTGAEDTWDVAVGLETDTNPASLAFENFETNTAEISALLDNTIYNVWVRSVCTGNDKGAWIGPVAFKTACLPVPTFTEDFETSPTPDLPSCWSKIIRGETVSEYAEIETSPWSNMPDPTTAVLMNTSNSTATDDIILVSPMVNTLSTGLYRLKFIAKGISTLQVGTLNANTNTAIFTNVETVTTTNIPTQYVVEFTTDNGTDSYIGIRVNSDVEYTYVEIDNIVWQPIPLCPDVTSLEKTATTMNTATIAWDNNADLWEVAIGATSVTDPSTLTAIEVIDPEHTFDDLTAGTSYNVWVRAICGTLGNGAWNGPFMITSQCLGTSVPYIEDFETATNPELPGCTSSLNLADAPSTWYTNYYPGYGFENSTLTYLGDLYTDANAWFFTRGINLTAGESYTVSYRYGGASTDTFFYNNNLKVMYGTEASPMDMTLPVAEYLDFGLDAPVSQAVTITPPATGVYYFGFNVFSPNNSYYMYIDDIKVESALSTSEFDMAHFNYYPNPVKNILNISYINDITSVVIYNILGQEVMTKSVNDNLAKIDMSSLSQGTYLVKVTSGNSTKNIKVIKS